MAESILVEVEKRFPRKTVAVLRIASAKGDFILTFTDGTGLSRIID